MKYRYTKFTGDLFDELDLQDLVSKLSDLLLSSGFGSAAGGPGDGDDDRSMQALHDAILEALFSGGVLSDTALQQLLGEPADGDQEAARQQLEDLIQQIIERMMEQGFVTGAPDRTAHLSARNVDGARVLPADTLNVADLLSHHTVLLTVDAVRRIEALWGGERAAKRLAPVPVEA